MDNEENNQGVTLEDQDQSQSENTPSDEGQQDQGQEPSDTQGDEGATDNGSDDDPKEPQSKYYQRIKNENAQLRRFLSDPKALKEYLEKNGHIAPSKENQVNEEEELNNIAKQVVDENGLINLPKLVKVLDDRAIKKVDNLVTSYSRAAQQQTELKIQYNKDLESVYTDHPELNPESDQYVKEYNDIVGAMYIAQGGMQGKVRLSDVTKSFYQALGRERKAGSHQAQQQVIRKKAGALQQDANRGSSNQQDDTKTPETTIADRFRAAARTAK